MSGAHGNEQGGDEMFWGTPAPDPNMGGTQGRRRDKKKRRRKCTKINQKKKKGGGFVWMSKRWGPKGMVGLNV